ncbi:ABC transporter A, ABCA, partial [Kipferlia bialata]|eukprot:g10153.t1
MVSSWSQMGTMFKKNLTVTLRHPLVLLIQFILPVAVMLSLTGDPLQYSPGNPQPDLVDVTLPERCYTSDPVNHPCTTFVYTPNTDPFVQEVAGFISDMYAGVDGDALNADEMRGFATREELDDWTLDHQEEFLGGWDFGADMCLGETGCMATDTHTYKSACLSNYERCMNYTVMFNRTASSTTTQPFEVNYMAPYQLNSMAQRAMVAALLGEHTGTAAPVSISDVDWNTQLRPYPTVDTVTGVLDKMSSGMPAAIVFVVTFSYVVISFHVVSEKQAHLRRALHVIGLTDTAFWGSHILHDLVLTLCQALLIMAT